MPFDLRLKQGVVNKLKKLPIKLQKKYLGSAVRKGANIIKQAAVSKAKSFDDPETSEKVYKEIVVRTNSRLGKANGGIAMQVGVKGGAKRYRNNKANRRTGKAGQSYEGPGKVYYWRFLEFGTSKMAAQPFMRPALANNVGAATDAITSSINDGIDRIVTGGN